MTDRRADAWRLVRDERQDLAAFFRSLTPDDWQTPSLCPGWRIRDVAAHLLIDEPVQAGAVRRALPVLIRGGFSVDGANAWWVEHNRHTAVESITTRFVEDSQRGVGFFGHVLGPGVALRALLVHHQDMRRPLQRTRSIPPERLLASLHALMTWRGTLSVGSRARGSGLRLRAVDVGWTWGTGPEVRGPAEAMILSLAGRQAALMDLEGEGKEILAGRCLPVANP